MASSERGVSKATSGWQSSTTEIVTEAAIRARNGMSTFRMRSPSGQQGALFSHTRCTKTKFAHEELTFIAVQGGKFHPRGIQPFAVLASGVSAIVYHEKIHAPCLGSEMSSGGLLGDIEPDKGLPAGAQVMFSRVHGGVEIGVGLGGADPIAVEAKARRRSWDTLEVRVVLEEIDESFSWFGFDQGMLRAVRFHVELGVLGTAAGSGGRFRWSILRGGSCGESKKKNCRK